MVPRGTGCSTASGAVRPARPAGPRHPDFAVRFTGSGQALCDLRSLNLVHRIMVGRIHGTVRIGLLPWPRQLELLLTFVFTSPGVVAREIEPWREAGQTWRRLEVRFPRPIATHHPERVLCLDSNGLQRRSDHIVEINGSALEPHRRPPIHAPYSPLGQSGHDVLDIRCRVFLVALAAVPRNLCGVFVEQSERFVARLGGQEQVELARSQVLPRRASSRGSAAWRTPRAEHRGRRPHAVDRCGGPSLLTGSGLVIQPAPWPTDSRMIDFDLSYLRPKAAQKPHPPIFIGGDSDATVKRVIRARPMTSPDGSERLHHVRVRCISAVFIDRLHRGSLFILASAGIWHHKHIKQYY